MNKLEELYSISSQIISKYNKLTHLPNNIVSSTTYQEMINEIKNLVFEEYKIAHSMSIVDITISLEKIKLSGYAYDNQVLARVTTKILDYREVLRNKSIITSMLDIDCIPKDMEFSIFDVIISMIDIETIKSMKNKIYSLVISCEKDRKFVRTLKEELERAKYDFIFSSSTSEIIALYHNTDIDTIPCIDINQIKNKVKTPKENTLNNIVNNAIVVYTRKTLNILSNTTFYNNPKDVFHYLSLITSIEVLITHMDKSMLNELYKQCCSINNKNIENIKKLIRKKMDKDHQEEE